MGVSALEGERERGVGKSMRQEVYGGRGGVEKPSKMKELFKKHHQVLQKELERKADMLLLGKKNQKHKKLLVLKELTPNVQNKYARYIKSREWLNRRAIYFTKNMKACAICGVVKVHLHHMTYDTLGKELDSHLIPLCKKHHVEYHKVYPYPSVKTTLEFVRTLTLSD